MHYPTLLDLTFPELEAAVARSDIALVPIAAVEEHGPHLPLGSDSMLAVGQLAEVQSYLRERGVESLLAPPLNLGITTEAGDFTRDGTYMYPGSLTLSLETFVALYVELLRSMRDSGLHRFFLYSAHYGPRHLKAVAEVAFQASRFPGIRAWAVLHGENMDRLGMQPAMHILRLDNGRNFALLAEALGHQGTLPFSAHADGAETSEMLYRAPDAVRTGFRQHQVAPSAQFFDAYRSGDRRMNPGGMGGFPLQNASAEAGRQIAQFRAALMGEAIIGVAGKR